MRDVAVRQLLQVEGRGGGLPSSFQSNPQLPATPACPTAAIPASPALTVLPTAARLLDPSRLTRRQVAYASQTGAEIEFSPEDAGRSDKDFLVEALGVAIEAGATTLNIPDTVGYNTPEMYGSLSRT